MFFIAQKGDFMKLRFKQTVQDKNNGAMYAYNSVHEFDEKRAKEILAKGVAVLENEPITIKAEEPVKEEPVEQVEATEEAGEFKPIEKLTLDELKEMAKQMGLAVRGTKAELIERITNANE